jgi:hypothetical protein
MTFKSGDEWNGNRAGRPPGSKNKRTLLEEQLAQAAPAVQGVVINTALGGDMQAASLVLARVAAPLRARAEKVEFDFDPDAPAADNAKHVMLAVSEGRIDPDTGKMLLDMLCAFAGLRDVEHFLDELKRLRESKSSTIPGGVQQT